MSAMARACARLLAIGLAALTASVSLMARGEGDGDSKRQCIASSERAQVLRNERKLKEASVELVACSRPVCPPVIRQDCSQWMREVLELIPSIVIGARDQAGRDLSGVAVSIDGAAVTSKLDGKAIQLNPGVHSLRLESSGYEPRVEELVVREGEKSRIVTLTMAGTEPKVAKPVERREVAAPVEKPSPGVPALTWISGSIGVLALGAAGAFDVLAFSEASCRPACDPETTDSIRLKAHLAQGFLAGGLVAVGVAVTAFLLTRSPSTSTSAAVWRVPSIRW
jgi:hypothetical protein